MTQILSILWYLRTARAMLFWLYLWQLKEYHIGRFVDHFQTTKGKQIFLNPLFAGKLFLFGGLVFFPEFVWVLLFVYGFESLQAGKTFMEGRLLRPVLTKKTALLILLSFGVAAIFLGETPLVLLGFDILVPGVVSALVLFAQPLAAMMRGRIIAKARKKREQMEDLITVGITGSYGKTSTKEFLAHILSKKFRVLKTKEHQNSEVGVSNCILQELKPDHEVFVCEMGAYNKGGISLLAGIAKPRIAILMGANEQHLATFGSMENLLSAEGGRELLEALPAGGTVIMNGDSVLLQSQISNLKSQNHMSKLKIISCSVAQKKDMWAEDIQVERESIAFTAKTKEGEEADFQVNVLGGYNVINILLAVGAAKELGMGLGEIATAASSIPAELGAMRLKKGAGGLHIIDSTYSANPDGVMAALEYLKMWSGNPEGPRPSGGSGAFGARKILVMPCLIELGRASKNAHRRIGEKIGEVCDLTIITTKDRFDEIKKESGGSEKILFMEDPYEIAETIKGTTSPGDVVLLEGRVPSKLLALLLLRED